MRESKKEPKLQIDMEIARAQTNLARFNPPNQTKKKNQAQKKKKFLKRDTAQICCSSNSSKHVNK